MYIYLLMFINTSEIVEGHFFILKVDKLCPVIARFSIIVLHKQAGSSECND